MCCPDDKDAEYSDVRDHVVFEQVLEFGVVSLEVIEDTRWKGLEGRVGWHKNRDGVSNCNKK